MQHSTDRLLLRPEEAFERLQISRSHGFALIKSGDLPSVKLGRCRRIPVDALRKFMLERSEGRVSE